jgi:hypothetical protein
MDVVMVTSLTQMVRTSTSERPEEIMEILEAFDLTGEIHWPPAERTQ